MSFYDKTSAVRREVTIAGQTVSVLEGPRLKHYHFVKNISSALKSLAEGMGVTMNVFAHPSKVVTQQYPENRETLKMYDRYRAVLKMTYSEAGYHYCTVCRSCEKACPNHSIKLIDKKGEVTGKKELVSFTWRMDSCVMCNLCVFSCPFDAIKMDGHFENAVYDRRLLVMNLNRYEGPHEKLMDKIEDEEVRKAQMIPKDVFSGPVPLNGTWLPGLPTRFQAEQPEVKNDDSEGGEA